jgi:hypothetical protein
VNAVSRSARHVLLADTTDAAPRPHPQAFFRLSGRELGRSQLIAEAGDIHDSDCPAGRPHRQFP